MTVTNEERNLAAVQFIFDEVQRFRLMSPQEVRSYFEDNPDDIFAHLNHPSLGMLLCGRAASDRFGELAKRTIKQGSAEAKSFHQPDYVRALRDAFVEVYVDGRRAVNQRSVAKLVNRAKSLALGSLVQFTHHLPCTLFIEKEPNEFSLGPVTFMRIEKFFDESENSLSAYRQSWRECTPEAGIVILRKAQRASRRRVSGSPSQSASSSGKWLTASGPPVLQPSHDLQVLFGTVQTAIAHQYAAPENRVPIGSTADGSLKRGQGTVGACGELVRLHESMPYWVKFTLYILTANVVVIILAHLLSEYGAAVVRGRPGDCTG